jgi:RecB family exonuclease
MATNIAWSPSRLKSFETCPHQFWHYEILRDVQKPDSEELRHGNVIHNAFAAYVSLGTPLPPDLVTPTHESFLQKLAKAATAGRVRVEQSLALTRTYATTEWRSPNAWFRVRLDYVDLRGSLAIVLDYKTGKPRPDDRLQLQLQAAAVFAHAASVTTIRAGLWYIESDEKPALNLAREEVPDIWAAVEPRVEAMADAIAQDRFPPVPNHLCRRHCAVTSCPFHGT